jgi:hypothetical protein
MQALKSLVIGLGILIVVSIGLLGWGMYTKLSTPRGDDAATGSASSANVAPAVPPAFGEVRLSVPAGCSIVEMRPSADRLFLRLGPAGACERIIMLDTASGKVVGSVLVTP